MRKLFIFILFCNLSSTVFAHDSLIEEYKHIQQNLHLLIKKDAISEKIAIVAEELNTKYAGKEVVLLAIMKGSFCFVSDLMQQLHPLFSIEMVKCSSYGMLGKKRGELTIKDLDQLDLKNKHVLIADDIFDSGNTLTQVVKAISQKNPASIETIVLLLKDAPRIANCILPTYFLFQIENHFVLGYGLDYKECFRGLEGIYYFEENTDFALEK